jgi:septal ring factor EnvC (AmiA/AmiB activator)
MPSSTLVDYSKSELQTILKNKYKINKNISGDLTEDECRQVLSILARGHIGFEKLLSTYADKNGNLSKNNAFYGRQRSVAEKKSTQLQQECDELQKTIAEMEHKKSQLSDRKTILSLEHQNLEKQVRKLEAENLQFSSQISQLDSANHKLAKVNHELKQDNKRLKNLVDAIRLNLSKSIKGILGNDENEIKMALAKLYKSLLG